MALSASTVLEIRTTGNDLNGGGFVTGSGGTDYSQQDTPQYSFTDLVIDATTNTKVTSASHSFVNADVGNLINVISGTGFTTGRYQVISVASGVATLDRAVGTVSSTGGTWRLGGALLTWGLANSLMTVAGMKAYVKAGTYNLTTTTVNVAGGPVSTTVRTLWEGYQTTRGDLGTAPILANASALINITFFNDSGQQGAIVVNLAIDCQNANGCNAWNCGPFSFYHRCQAYRAKGNGFGTAQQSTMVGCYAEACQFGFNSNAVNTHYACVAKGNTHGFTTGGEACFISCISYSNSGNGFFLQARVQLINCVAYGNGNAGYYGSLITGLYLLNCVAENNQYGLNLNSVQAWVQNFATYNNSLGAFNGVPVANINPITGTASFFVAGASGNFALSTAAGGGALLKGLGYPQAFIVNGTLSAPDIGAAQSGSAGGGAGGAGGSFVFVG